jgi:membrane glycosyltransferase
MAFAHTRVMIAFVAGRAVGWDGQARDAVGVPWDLATRNLWRHTVAGAAVIAGLVLAASPGAFWMGFAVAGGCLLAIPFAVWTADPGLGASMARAHIAAIPEEIEPPDEVDALDLPAVRYAQAEE